MLDWSHFLPNRDKKAYVVERDVGAFFDAICDLNNDRSKLEVLSRENLIKIEQFAWEKVLTSHFDFFSKTIANSKEDL
jgi:hypothetical protein